MVPLKVLLKSGLCAKFVNGGSWPRATARALRMPFTLGLQESPGGWPLAKTRSSNRPVVARRYSSVPSWRLKSPAQISGAPPATLCAHPRKSPTCVHMMSRDSKEHGMW
eukprot:Amastigsp_a2993_21.p4 type:complete len:109 gc:universal Amastigsp_a2993_21:1084-758(-)